MTKPFRKIILVLPILIAVFVVIYKTTPIQAQSTGYTKFVWEILNPLNTSPSADDLKTKLDSEVNKTINAGHLAPFRTLYGENYTHFSWYRPSDIVYTLSVAYPYVQPATQSRISTYLKSEMQSYPLWTSNYLDTQTGTKREPESLSASERGSLPGEYGSRPRLFNLYALWTYYNATSDKAYIQSNWSQITSFYSNYRSETTKFYNSIAGAIGMARLAYAIGDSGVNSYTQDALSGFSAGTNFSTFATNAENAYKFSSGDWTSWVRNEIAMGFQFYDLTPELVRYFAEDSQLTNQVVGTKTNPTTYLGGVYTWPLWFMAQGPVWSRWYGEGAYLPPEARQWYFPLAAWLTKEPTTKLRVYVDQPDALVGDLYYIQNLVTTIQRSGQTCWKNLQNQVNSCI